MYDMRNIQDIKENIYITNYEEIKPNVYALINRVLCKTELLDGKIVSRQLLSGATMDICKGEYSEIILTTDQDLIKDGVQDIDDEFLEWFVKNPSCESVEVKQELGVCLNCEWNYDSCPNAKECLKGKYKIIIPKEEPKQEDMKQTAVELLKQRLIKDQQVFPIYNEYINGILYDINNELLEMEKQQQGYSEEEMLKMLHKFGFDYTYNYKGEKTIYEWIPEWFEEYKRLEQLNK
jgi:hypothetical protein